MLNIYGVFILSKWISKKFVFVLFFIFFTIVFFELFFRFIPVNVADEFVSYLNPFYIFSNLSIIVGALLLISLVATILLHSLIFK